MLNEIGNLVERHPLTVIAVITLITIGFTSIVPLLKTGTSLEDFLPNTEVVHANKKVSEYFGKNPYYPIS